VLGDTVILKARKMAVRQYLAVGRGTGSLAKQLMYTLCT